VETDDGANGQALPIQSVLRGNRLAVNGVPVLRYSAWGFELPEPTLNAGILWCSSSMNPNAVAIPAWEVFRFFYGVSSVLARAFLTPWILEPETYIWRPELSTLDQSNGRAMLWLRKYMYDADARYIAAYAFSRGAIERAKAVYLKMASDPEHRIDATPPFPGVTRLYAEGIDVTNSENMPTFFVTRILHADHKLPFNHVLFDRDNPGGAGERDELRGQRRKPQFLRSPHATVLPDDSEDELFAADDPVELARNASHALSEDVGGRFSWLREVTEHKQKHETTPSDDEQMVRLIAEKRWTQLITTTRASGQTVESADVLARVEVLAHDPSLVSTEPYNQETELELDREASIEDRFLKYVGLIEQISDHRQTYGCYTVAKPLFAKSIGRLSNGGTYSLLPRSYDGESYPWLRSRGDGRRRVAVYEVCKPCSDPERGDHDRHRYVIEFEIRERESKRAMALIYRNDEQQLQFHELRHIVRRMVEDSRISASVAYPKSLMHGQIAHRMPEQSNSGTPDSKRQSPVKWLIDRIWTNATRAAHKFDAPEDDETD
jgi:hypothetical protein